MPRLRAVCTPEGPQKDSGLRKLAKLVGDVAQNHGLRSVACPSTCMAEVLTYEKLYLTWLSLRFRKGADGNELGLLCTALNPLPNSLKTLFDSRMRLTTIYTLMIDKYSWFNASWEQTGMMWLTKDRNLSEVNHVM